MRDVFEAAFADRQVLRGYVLDDQGAVRHHVAVFVDGERLRDTARQSDPVRPDSVIHVMQALSGG